MGIKELLRGVRRPKETAQDGMGWREYELKRANSLYSAVQLPSPSDCLLAFIHKGSDIKRGDLVEGLQLCTGIAPREIERNINRILLRLENNGAITCRRRGVWCKL